MLTKSKFLNQGGAQHRACEPEGTEAPAPWMAACCVYFQVYVLCQEWYRLGVGPEKETLRSNAGQSEGRAAFFCNRVSREITTH